VNVKSISYNYDNEFMTEEQIVEMFRDVEDSSGLLFDLYCDTEDVSVEEMIGYLKKNKYVVLVS
jgi:hypothetical protein